MTKTRTDAPPPRAILFDLDGTLIDTFRLYAECLRRTLTPYLGYTPTDEEMIARGPGSERSFLLGWLGVEAGERAHADFGRHYEALHGGLHEGLYDGVPEMLAALRAAGYPLGVVTGKGRHAWNVTDREMGLGEFAVVVTDDDVAAPKPDPQGLLAAARALGLPPGEIVYVGDSDGDLLAGRAAGMRTAAVLWPKTTPGEAERFVKKVEPLDPGWVFGRPADVTRAFARWC
ncbi:MAG TPA: HAD family hydrolase [Longimicrobium sp.]|jgi:phosphoglycolate phosphatase/pyrophosphatase PpaX|nr:HAD family hydrolase [Longimicrobium sp.]